MAIPAREPAPAEGEAEEIGRIDLCDPEVEYIEPREHRRRPALVWRSTGRRGTWPNPLELTEHHQPFHEDHSPPALTLCAPCGLPRPSGPRGFLAHKRALQEGPEDSLQGEFLHLVPRVCATHPDQAARVLSGLHALYLAEEGDWTVAQRHELLDLSLGELLLGMPAHQLVDLHRLWWAALQRLVAQMETPPEFAQDQ